MNLIKVSCILLCIIGDALCARILGLFPITAKSHFIVTSAVMKALAEKGHDVTTFSPFTSGFNSSNYREIIYDAGQRKMGTDILTFMATSHAAIKFSFFAMGLATTEGALKSPEAKALMMSEEKFDIIILEQFVNEAFLAYVHKFNCPVVLISTFGVTTALNGIVGNSAPYSYVPSEFLPLSDRMNFIERLKNAFIVMYSDFLRKYYYMPKQQALAEKYWADSGITIPSLEEIEHRANFVLLNSHDAFSTPRPYMPNMKDIAGIHLQPAKPLPSDLKEYLDSSKNGVILFSLGSAMQAISIPDFISVKLKGAFNRLPYNVLWKWENDTMADKPKNVRIGKWLPQNDILAHPNLKLFVTHGGISSLMETVYHGVPIVGMPLFADQARNVLISKSKGYAEYLDFPSMTEDEIYTAIMKVVTDKKYQDNVKKVSAYWKDELNHPSDVAVHWIEYVLKHDGARHLRAFVIEQSFVQYLLLDIAFAILLTLFLVYYTIRKIFSMICRKFISKENSKKTN